MIFIGIKCDECGAVGITQERPPVQFSIDNLAQTLREAVSRCRWRPRGGPRNADLCPDCIKKLSVGEKRELGKYTV
jgi:hypothetical protein